MSRFQKAAGRELQPLQFRATPLDCRSLMLAIGISVAQAQDRVVAACWRGLN